MADREKVIYSIERCICHVPDACRDCGYDNHEYNECVEKLLRDALELLKKQESEWLEDSYHGQEYGTTWACRKCGHSIHKPFIWNPYTDGYKYCVHCGRKMKLNLNEEN